MEFKAIPFSHLSFDPSLNTVTRDDFSSIINQDFFHFDESEEAISIMSDKDMAVVAEFDAKHAV